MVPYEAFLAEKPVLTTTDAGGPLEIVHDRETGLVAEPEVGALARACSELSPAPTRRARLGKGGKRARRDVSPGTAPSTASSSSHEGRLLLAASARDVGDRRLLGAAPPGAAGASRARGGRQGEEGAARRGPRALPRRQRPGRARLDRRRAPQAAGPRRPARARAAPPDRRDHDRPPRRPRLPRRDGARLRARRAPARARRPREPRALPLGGATAGLPALRRDPRPRRGGARSSTRATSRRTCARAATPGRVWRIPHPAWTALSSGPERACPRV